MKRLLLILGFITLSLISKLSYSEDKFSSFFTGTTAHCFILYDITHNKPVYHEGGTHCDKQFSPAVNFLLPLTIIAFDSQVITNTTQQFKWDGQIYENKTWQQDQTPSSWVKNNVLWVSEIITNKIGSKKMNDYLKKLNYGNHDISSGITKFWLNGESLKISSNQQLKFIKNFSSYKLPVSQNSIDNTKKLFIYEENNNWQIIGKAGAGTEGDNKYGWFVGEVSNGKEKYVFVTNILGNEKYFANACPGCKTREITKDILASLGLF
jgi:beta-lactamase class D